MWFYISRFKFSQKEPDDTENRTETCQKDVHINSNVFILQTGNLVINLLLFHEVSLQCFFPSFLYFLAFRNIYFTKEGRVEENEAFEEKEALGFIILRTKQKKLHLSFEELNESKRKKKI